MQASMQLIADGIDRINAAERAVIHPLRMHALDVHGQTYDALAFNEVSLLRQTRQTAKLRISIDGKVRLAELVCDGVLVSTPAGSTLTTSTLEGSTPAPLQNAGHC